MGKNFTLEYTAGAADQGKMLREFLKEKEISKSALTDIKFKGGFISVNRQEVNVRYILKSEDFISVGFPPEVPSEGLKGEEIPLEIQYEDEHLLVVNKPAGMNTIPSREHPYGSLANALIGYYECCGLSATTHIVTRLDRDTSGLVLIAKHSHIHHLFSKQQRAGGVKRKYEALAEDIIHVDEGRIEEPIARKQDSIIEREVHPDGQYACTLFEVENRYEDFTHIILRLLTGRTHQIRVHMSHLGHPLLGDTLYGGNKNKMLRQALHCCELSFIHPTLQKELLFNASLPTDMVTVLEKGRSL
ncbi:RluA family pseudouridine synthase [Mesobacillus selenatarsenatis]|uniref:Pseudouridine synthase n=1 Tax=Mesobacillus selenatarsenatis (strain DSM 18680 / JCM 14380 / FERM P-15431 / SF-1) TaxID=1321606 RepID=A0A0A8XBE6_MESS1|nr:RluA family pseudouridine synthase [Mesobacillus selenatarsenatis]GAM16594.1 similar to ribosomal large subunit pseudouridine synthase D, Bacillus subtilis YjbO type [Mesobacillus selenatarsenatis SF-1]